MKAQLLISIVIGIFALSLAKVIVVKENGSRAVNASALVISVYYETLCPDSIRFITRQLFPLYKALGGHTNNSYFEIDFVPYGKANTTFNNGSYSFVCQHGPRECEGNKMHACALEYFPPPANASVSIADFINCSMSSPDPPSAGPACAQQLGVNFTRIQNCLTQDGPSLLAYLGNRTHSLNPTLYYVPWIIHNNVFTEEDLWDSQDNLLNVVCRKLEELGAAQPDSCDSAKK